MAIMKTMGLESLRRYRREILDVAARHGARNVRVFGSVARGDDHEGSDVDVLIDVEPGRTLLDVIALEQDLQQLLGRHVEVLTDGGLSPYLQQRILAEAASL
jgi:predicted nucleotidyltransferase